ncbi:MAG TPA: histidine kinase, partial [Burkholderiaceae bacterium]
MHPLFSDGRHLIWYLAACLFIGNVVAWFLSINGAPQANAEFFCLPVSIMFGFVAMSAYYVCRSQPLVRRRLPRLLLVYLVSSLLSGFILLMLCYAWASVGESIGAGWTMPPSQVKFPTTVFGFGAGTYLLSILTHDVFIAMDNVRQSELRERESRTLAREAELQLLRMQINPHFLFNSLNSISALTSIDAAAARAMTIALAQFFRQTLALADKEKIALATEFALCDSFLAV